MAAEVVCWRLGGEWERGTDGACGISLPLTDGHCGPLKLRYQRRRAAPKWVLLGALPRAFPGSAHGPGLATGLVPASWPSAELGWWSWVQMLLLGQPTALVMMSWPALLVRMGNMGTRRSWDQPWDPELELLCDCSAQQLLGRGRGRIASAHCWSQTGLQRVCLVNGPPLGKQLNLWH